MQRYDPNITGVKYYCISVRYNGNLIVFKFTISQLSESKFVIRLLEHSVFIDGLETVVFKYNNDKAQKNCENPVFKKYFPYSNFLEFLHDNTYEYDNFLSACLGDFYRSKQTDMVYMYYLTPEGELIKLFDYSISKENFSYESMLDNTLNKEG